MRCCLLLLLREFWMRGVVVFGGRRGTRRNEGSIRVRVCASNDAMETNASHVNIRVHNSAILLSGNIVPPHLHPPANTHPQTLTQFQFCSQKKSIMTFFSIHIQSSSIPAPTSSIPPLIPPPVPSPFMEGLHCVLPHSPPAREIQEMAAPYFSNPPPQFDPIRKNVGPTATQFNASVPPLCPS